jgi:putative hemolysin
MLTLELLLIVVLILVNGLLSMSELAVVSARTTRLRTLAERGAKGARRALALHSNPGRFLSTVQIGITLVGVVAGAVSGATLGARLEGALRAAGIHESVAEPLAYAVVVGAITYLSVVVGELVPKQIALKRAEPIACLVAPAMTVLARLAAPFVWLLDLSARGVLALSGRAAEPAAHVTDEEVRSIIAEAESAGVLEPEERRMITGVLRLGDRPVRAIMTPRRDVDMVDLAAEPAAIAAAIAASRHARLPAFEGSPDAIVGILQAKDLLDAQLAARPSGDAPGLLDLRAALRQAPVIPEAADALDALATLKRTPVHIGLVHDEYGHFTGIVTTADILEAIAGAFRTEEGEPEPNVVRRADGSYLISGAMPIDELADLLGLPLPAPRDYHTVAGFVLEGFGRIPRLGETFIHHGWRFEVLDLDGRRIDKVGAARLSTGRRAS